MAHRKRRRVVSSDDDASDPTVVITVTKPDVLSPQLKAPTVSPISAHLSVSSSTSVSSSSSCTSISSSPEQLNQIQNERTQERIAPRLDQIQIERTQKRPQLNQIEIERTQERRIAPRLDQIDIERTQGRINEGLSARLRAEPVSHVDSMDQIISAAASASMQCMEALKSSFGPGAETMVQGGHTRLIHSTDANCGASAHGMKSYQLAGVQWMETLHGANFGCILADEMGLGKTLQVLRFLEKRSEDKRPALVVVPTSLLSNWEDEIAKWTSLRAFRYHHASATVRAELASEYFALSARPQIILTTPNILLNQNDRKTFMRRAGPFSTLICDEGHFLKNSKSGKVINLGKVDASVRILLTGTPVQNDLSELVNLLWFILPDSFREIRDHFNDRGTLPLELIQKLGAPFILRRRKVDVLDDLPSKNVVPVWCHMGENQRKYHDGLRDEHRNDTTNNFKSLYSRLRRICNAPILSRQKFGEESYIALASLLRKARPDYAAASSVNIMRELTQWSDYEVHQVAMEYGFEEPFRATASEIVAGCKIKALLDLLRQREGKKTLIFSQYTQYLDVLEAVLSLNKYTYARLDGSTPTDSRQSLVKEFSSPHGPQVFMLSTKAGGTGLNLVAADACILMDLDFNPQNNRQAEDRIHRLGQTRDVTIYYLLCKDTLEEKILAVNARKIDLDEKFGGHKHGVDPANVLQWIMT